MELMSCQNLAVPNDVMQHVVRIESSNNPYAIGVVGGRLARQPRSLAEALATARMLESRGFNFSVGLAQVNRHNLRRHGLDSYERAFDACANLQAGARILAECYGRSGGDWGKSFSCYYSGNFTIGYRHGYVQKIYASMRDSTATRAVPIDVIVAAKRTTKLPSNAAIRTPIRTNDLVAQRRMDSEVRQSIANVPASSPLSDPAGAPRSAPPATSAESVTTQASTPDTAFVF